MILVNRLDKRVTIQQLTTATDKYGQPTDVWTDVVSVWAAIEPLQGNEFFAAESENVNVSTRIRIRYRDGIDRTMNVQYGAHKFEILHIINPKFENKELQLMCKERQ